MWYKVTKNGNKKCIEYGEAHPAFMHIIAGLYSEPVYKFEEIDNPPEDYLKKRIKAIEDKIEQQTAEIERLKKFLPPMFEKELEIYELIKDVPENQGKFATILMDEWTIWDSYSDALQYGYLIYSPAHFMVTEIPRKVCNMGGAHMRIEK